MDDNFGCLSFESENKFQKNIQAIVKTEDFGQYYKSMGLERARDQNELNALLVKAVKSSRAKGYHGQEHDSKMPEP